MIPTYDKRLGEISTLEEVTQYQEWKENAENKLNLKS
jgi:hypothetical protein